jgi:hypothetical protein
MKKEKINPPADVSDLNVLLMTVTNSTGEVGPQSPIIRLLPHNPNNQYH